MFKNALFQNQVSWISINSGTIIRVVILLLVVITAVMAPQAVLADAVMGGSVG